MKEVIILSIFVCSWLLLSQENYANSYVIIFDNGIYTYNLDVTKQKYSYSIETSDATVKQTGQQKGDNLQVEGGYEIVDENGVQYIVNYTANTNGYRAKVIFGARGRIHPLPPFPPPLGPTTSRPDTPSPPEQPGQYHPGTPGSSGQTHGTPGTPGTPGRPGQYYPGGPGTAGFPGSPGTPGTPGQYYPGSSGSGFPGGAPGQPGSPGQPGQYPGGIPGTPDTPGGSDQGIDYDALCSLLQGGCK